MALTRLAVLFVFLAPLQATLRVIPESPRWGERLVVRAGLEFAETRLCPSDHLFVDLVSYRRGLAYTQTKSMSWNGTEFEAELGFPEGAEYAQVHLRTSEKFVKQKTDLVPLNASGERPKGSGTMGLHMGAGDRGEWEEIVRREFSADPQPWMYIQLWGLRIIELGNMEQGELLSQLAALEELPRSAELLRTLAYGYWLGAQFQKALLRLEELCQEFPESPYTIRALNDASHQAFTNGLDKMRERVAELAVGVVNRAPENPYLPQEINALGWIWYQSEVTLSSLRALHHHWSQAEPENPYPYALLGVALAREREQADEAEQLLTEALNLFVRPLPYSSLRNAYIGLTLRARSELRERQHRYADALADSRLAQHFTIGRWADDVDSEAQLWKKAGYPIVAEEIGLRAYRSGSLKAEAFLQNLYFERNGKVDGFQEYLVARLVEQTDEPESSPDPRYPPAPSFRGTSLDGDRIDLESLSGEVVAINFWFTACAPCLNEIPGLNEIVKKYKDKVRFLAFARDPADEVRKFLAKREFAYVHVAEASGAIEAFGVHSFPTHVLIDREGRIVWSAPGASPENLETLETLIVRVLTGRY